MTNPTVQAGKRATYPAYRPSGVDWLGDVPEHWHPVRLRYRARINPSRSELNGAPGTLDVSFVPMESVHEYGGLSLDQTRPLAEVATGYTYFKDGDVLAAKITPCFENGKGSIAQDLVNGIGFGTTELHVLRPCPGLCCRFLFYVTISHAFRHLGAAEMYGAGGQKRVPEDFFRDFRQPIPSLDEQHAIAAFLDRETARIDSLIAKKQRQIELLQEKRAALISHAVTKGLDPNVKMKDSGIEWLGRIPEHWRVARLGWHARVFNGCTPSRSNSEYWFEGTVPWLSSGKVNEDIVNEPSEWITEAALNECALQMVPQGSVLLGMVGQGRTRGTSAWLGFSSTINQNMAAIVPLRNLAGRFLHFVFQHMYDPIREYGRGANQAALNCEQVADLRVPIPPVDEQLAIVARLDAIASQDGSFRNGIEHSVSTLREYRTALISAAVTGKIDAREEVPA